MNINPGDRIRYLTGHGQRLRYGTVRATNGPYVKVQARFRQRWMAAALIEKLNEQTETNRE